MHILNKLTDFVKHPHVPNYIIRKTKIVSVPFAKFLSYGNFDLNTKQYWDKRWSEHEYSEKEENDYLILREKVIKNIKPGSKVLDVGCGSGKFMEMLNEKLKCSCTGIDISAVSIDLVKNLGFEGYRTKLPKLPDELVNRKFDTVTILETLEHLNHPENTIKALHSVVRSDGNLIITVPNDCMGPKDFDEHMQIFTINSLTSLISGYFKVEHSTTVVCSGKEYILLKAEIPL